eukprot:5834267-Amphidinium_carterae.1
MPSNRRHSGDEVARKSSRATSAGSQTSCDISDLRLVLHGSGRRLEHAETLPNDYHIRVRLQWDST